MHKQTPIVVSN
ncbi:unnamed protein product [Debaryomyces tyrocola]|nr:unnamed protein product [Debaryomyces tyrocola]